MKPSIRTLAASLVVAALFTAVAGFGLLDSPDGTVSDALYQRPAASDGEIVVIGMDQRALDALGPMPWPRSYMADAINYLNSDPEQAPAVIGIDVLYVGESADPDGDAALADAAGMGGNVVTAAAATFGSGLVEGGDGFYMDTRAVLAWDQPFDALDTPPVDPRQLAGAEGSVTQLTRAQFADIWEQSREMPDGFMGMFF